MVYQLDRIKRDVRVCIDQNQNSGALVIDNDTDMLTLEDVIESKIVEAVDMVHTMAPYWLLDTGHNFDGSLSDAVYWGNQASGWVILPEDFLRLVVFKMSDWERPVYEPIAVNSPMYRRQHSRIKALRGTAQRPVCAVAVHPEGKVLEFWSCKNTNAYITRSVYVPRAVIDTNGGVEICERCYQSVVYAVASLTMTSCGETERAGNYLELMKKNLEK